MWALLLKYVVMMQAGPEKAIQPSVRCCEIQGEEMILKKILQVRIKKERKKKKEKKERKRRNNQSPMVLDWTEKCLAFAT